MISRTRRLGVINSYYSICALQKVFFAAPAMGTAESDIKVPSSESPELSKALSVKSRARQNIALHAAPTATNTASLLSTLSVHSTSFFPSPLPHKMLYDSNSERDFYL